MEAGEEKGGWETGFGFLIFTEIEKMGVDSLNPHSGPYPVTGSLPYYKFPNDLETENHFLRIEMESKWNRNGIEFICIDLVSMYGEIT